jgi:hypothetical protein
VIRFLLPLVLALAHNSGLTTVGPGNGFVEGFLTKAK